MRPGYQSNIFENLANMGPRAINVGDSVESSRKQQPGENIQEYLHYLNSLL